MYHDREIRNYLIPVVINSSLERSNYAFSPFAIEQSWAILRNSKFKNRWLRYRLPDIDSLAVPSKTSSYQIAGNKCTGCVARVHRHTCVRCCATSCTSFRSTVMGSRTAISICLFRRIFRSLVFSGPKVAAGLATRTFPNDRCLSVTLTWCYLAFHIPSFSHTFLFYFY